MQLLIYEENFFINNLSTNNKKQINHCTHNDFLNQVLEFKSLWKKAVPDITSNIRVNMIIIK
jgi:hypothetical protein